jgi:hypothetical protein
METLRDSFTTKYEQAEGIISVLAFQSKMKFPALTDGFRMLLLVITEAAHTEEATLHYIKDGWRIQERRLTIADFEKWAFHGENRDVINWILQGEIIVDRNAYLDNFRQKLLDFPVEMKEQKLLNEFSLFLRKYMQSREYLQEEHLLDAYGNLLEALHHWARIAIIEAGIHPEVTVWEQIHTINAGIYKLYEELTQSPESLLQRIQLVLLACEFSVVSKMESCCGLLLRIVSSRKEAWSVGELQAHPQLKDIHVNLSLLLHKLVNKMLLREVVHTDHAEFAQLELRYTK